MAGRGELGFLKSSSNGSGACSLKEQMLRTTLRNVRLQGHPYVDLREDGKKLIFFCTLCLAPCYGDTNLFDHLRGSLHAKRYAAAKVTLLKPNPWPFNDGVLFFHDSLLEKERNVRRSNGNGVHLLDDDKGYDGETSLAIVTRDDNMRSASNGSQASGVYADCENSSDDGDANGNDLVIPGVLCKGEISDLQVRFMGVGQIGARVCENDQVSERISKIWLEWLGKKDSGDENALMIPEHEFAVITFAYNYDLGRKGLIDDVRYLLLSGPPSDIEETEGSGKKKRKSFSDPGDKSESFSTQYNSSGEESLSSKCTDSRLLLDGYSDQLLDSRVLSSKTMRKELRRQQRIAAEKMCDICQQKMLPDKDVAALLNTKTGRIVCSSRNVNGAFHVFHISCLLHWILLCESELYGKQLVRPESLKAKRKSRRKNAAKLSKKRKENETRHIGKQIYSVFCPECQGTGINIDGAELEKPTVHLSEMFKYKIKASDAHRAWMRSPEVLDNCSTGFHFPSQSVETTQEKVSALKLLRFYRADD